MRRMTTAISKKSILTVSIFALFGMCIKPNIIMASIMSILILISLFWLFGKKDVELCSESSVPSLAAAALSCFIGIGFYDTWIMSSKLELVAEKTGLSSSVLLLGITVVAVLLSVPFAVLVFNNIASKLALLKKSENSGTVVVLKNTFKDILALKKSVFVLFAILIFAMLAIIRANVNYVDDIGRVESGYSNWGNYSRYVSEFICKFIHSDSYLNDVSPFPQLIALLVMAVAGVFAAYIFTGKTKLGVWEYVAVIPMCISPYFLGCLSFKYDSPYMALSVLFSIIPFLFRNLKFRYYFLISFISLLLMCMSYQASSGIYIVMVIFLAFRAWNTKEQCTKDIVKWVMVSAASFLCAMAVFKIIYDSFAYQVHRSVEMFAVNEMAGGIINNICTYFKVFLQDCKNSWIVLIGLICVGYVIAMCRASKQKKWIAVIMSFAVVATAAIFSFGAYLLLKEAATAPRYIYGIFVCFSIVAINGVRFAANISKVASLILSCSFIIFSFAYGNALVEQENYTDYEIELLAEDLSELEVVQGDKTVYFHIEGTRNHTRVVNNSPNKLMKKLMYTAFDDYLVRYYYDLDNLTLDNDTDFSQFELTTVCENIYYKIEVYEQYVLVTWK